jgi:hypothetical protein
VSAFWVWVMLALQPAQATNSTFAISGPPIPLRTTGATFSSFSLFLVQDSARVLFRVSPDKKVHVTPGVTAEHIAETWYRYASEGHCRW